MRIILIEPCEKFRVKMVDELRVITEIYPRYTVDPFSNGKDAIESIEKFNDVAIVITSDDLVAGCMDGFQVWRYVRINLDKEVPFLMLSENPVVLNMMKPGIEPLHKNEFRSKDTSGARRVIVNLIEQSSGIRWRHKVDDILCEHGKLLTDVHEKLMKSWSIKSLFEVVWAATKKYLGIK